MLTRTTDWEEKHETVKIGNWTRLTHSSYDRPIGEGEDDKNRESLLTWTKHDVELSSISQGTRRLRTRANESRKLAWQRLRWLEETIRQSYRFKTERDNAQQGIIFRLGVHRQELEGQRKTGPTYEESESQPERINLSDESNRRGLR